MLWSLRKACGTGISSQRLESSSWDLSLFLLLQSPMPEALSGAASVRGRTSEAPEVSDKSIFIKIKSSPYRFPRLGYVAVAQKSD